MSGERGNWRESPEVTEAGKKFWAVVLDVIAQTALRGKAGPNATERLATAQDALLDAVALAAFDAQQARIAELEREHAALIGQRTAVALALDAREAECKALRAARSADTGREDTKPVAWISMRDDGLIGMVSTYELNCPDTAELGLRWKRYPLFLSATAPAPHPPREGPV